MGIDPDLMEGARKAVRNMIAWLVDEHGLTREDAYILCSLAGDLRIHEIVDAGVWNVGMTLPLAVFDPAAGKQHERGGPRSTLHLERVRDLVPRGRHTRRRLVPDPRGHLPRRPGRRSRLHRADRGAEPLRPGVCPVRPARLREQPAPSGRAGRVLDAAALQGRAGRAHAAPGHRRTPRRRRTVLGRHARDGVRPRPSRRACAGSSSPTRRRA